MLFICYFISAQIEKEEPKLQPTQATNAIKVEFPRDKAHMWPKHATYIDAPNKW